MEADEKYVARAPAEIEKQVDEALGLKLISIRLPNDLIEAFKFLAEIEGCGYQPLMRDVLKRYANAELKMLARDIKNEDIKRAKELVALDSDAPEQKAA